MDFEFPPDAVMLRDMLRRFVEDEARPLEMKFFTTGSLEANERARLQKVVEQMGLWGITLPQDFGGEGLDTITGCMLDEELGKTFIPVDIGDLPPLLFSCQGVQIQKFLDPAISGVRRPFLALREPNALTPDVWTTNAVQDGDYFTLNGQKELSGMPVPEDFVVLFANTTAGPSVFLLDASHPGIQLIQDKVVLLQLKNCRVEPEALLGEIGQAFVLGIEEATRAGLRLGARYTGLAQRLLQMAVEYAVDYQSFGGFLKERPAVQQLLAELKVQIDCTRWLVYHAAWEADSKELLLSTAAEVRLATGEMLKKATDLVTLIFGGTGPSSQMEVYRFVHSAIPMKAFEIGLDWARSTVAARIFAQAKPG